MAASAVALVAAAITLILMFSGGVLYSMISLLLGITSVIVLQTGKSRGRSRPETWVGRYLFRKAKRKGATTYIAGPASTLPDSSYRAPGILASTQMRQYHDHYGRRFAFLWDPKAHTGTIFFGAEGGGTGLRDQDDIDGLVDGWAAYLRNIATTLDIVQVIVTTQSTRDPGMRLPAAVDTARHRSRVGQVPENATSTVDLIVDSLNKGVPRIEQRVMVTFSAAEIKDEGLKSRTPDELAADVSVIIPSLIEYLAGSGAGAVALLEPEDIIDQTYCAYNPSTALAVETARMTQTGTGLTWHDVGPSYATAHHDYYRHGSGFSRTLQAWKPPAGIFRENSLHALLQPDSVSEQKRVTLIYRPMSPEASAARVGAAVNNAQFEINQQGNAVTQAQLLKLQKARAAEAEQAKGAAVYRFSILITITVDDHEKLARAEAAARRACNTGVQLQIRDSFGNEDAAFALALGLGSIPSRHATIKPSVLEAL
ncbi:hypothetical protein FrondiHNR_01225 [Lysinibacter sp. HNR]|nr:SCO6880 family protein [Lysinibacter sp. HNR]WGD37575.1 hypothetical protein FrondiHNR_01225 [Lysinibacter sp. HNR]